MSKLSIYETSWINLVFENRNKEYGAYQLRRDYVKSSLTALFTAILLITSLGLLSKINLSSPSINIPDVVPPKTIDEVLTVTKVFLAEKKKNTVSEVKSKAPEEPITKNNLNNAVIVHTTVPLPDIPTNKELTNQKPTTSIGQGTDTVNPYSGPGIENTKPTDDGNSIIKATSLDKLPEFPGGIAKFYSYVGTNFEKPEIENLESIRVIVNFIIEKDGSMTGIQVKSDPGHGLANEAIRVLKSLKTKWAPGILNSKAVRTAYSLPITIQLE